MACFEDYFYQVKDGLTLYARDYRGPSANAPVVLCMHGLSRNSRDFSRIAPTLAKTHRVIVVEQRGRGRSDYDPQSDRYTPETYIGDMFELLAKLGIQSCATIGTSMGGLMAMGMNAIAPTLFTHVVINDIGPELATEGLDRIKKYVGTASEFPDWQSAVAHTKTVNGVAFPDYSDDEWRQFAEQICTEKGGRVMLDYDMHISDPMKNSDDATAPAVLWSLFDHLESKPLLLVRGELSDLLDMDCVEQMQRRHPRMQRLSVPRVGHAPMLDEPGVLDAIVAFINN